MAPEPQDIASYAWYTLNHDSDYRAVAFTVVEAYRTMPTCTGWYVPGFLDIG
jgi:hypothetical protein